MWLTSTTMLLYIPKTHLHPVILILLLLLHLLPLSTTNAYTPLSDQTLRALPSSNGTFDIRTGSLLSPILRPRVPGTPGSLAVLQHFIQFFHTHLPEWSLELQNSTSRTPTSGEKQIPFVNLIATRDPPWTKPGDVGRLALVAHYDSKAKPDGFIGATDSAAPCAMILHAAKSVDGALSRRWKGMMMMDGSGGSRGNDDDKGVQIILLDGEEAFVNWSDEDSLYGARSLAQTWEQTPHAALSTYKTPLSSINLFVRIDLLGASNPTIPSYFLTTHWAYMNLAQLESRMRNLSLFQSSPNHPSKHPQPQPQQPYNKRAVPEPVFLPNIPGGGFRIADDHIPFLQRGVEVLHLIPSPFPDVWHRIEDDGAHLDLDTVEDWARLVTGFVAEWMDLEGFFVAVDDHDDSNGKGSKRKAKGKRNDQAGKQQKPIRSSSSSSKTEL